MAGFFLRAAIDSQPFDRPPARLATNERVSLAIEMT
jgi:hypothetical protein